jgi:hypothetical protein
MLTVVEGHKFSFRPRRLGEDLQSRRIAQEAGGDTVGGHVAWMRDPAFLVHHLVPRFRQLLVPSE